METEIPVYVFFGFMDSGKTTLINETLFKNGFIDEMSAPLIISCEDGDEEYDESQFARYNVRKVEIEDVADFNSENLRKINDTYNPDCVFIEYNGTWESAPIYDMDGPKDWTIVQSLCTVDATTFEVYLKNMGMMMREQMWKADVVIFNRCTDETPKAKFRANVKGINRPAQIVYERADGSIDDSADELPFDISKDELEITDGDYALWFMDCMDHPEKYDGKIVSFLGLVYNPTEGKGKLKPGSFVPGRFAMTCCVEDIQFLGMKCKAKDFPRQEHKSWINIRAKVKNEFAIEYKGRGPVLYPIEITPASKPADELVYFS